MPGGRQEPAAGVLAVDAELDRVPTHLGVAVAELLAVGDPEHLAHQVDAGDLLGDRVLDLQAGVHLEERDGAVLPDEELAGAGADVAGLREDRLGGAVQLGGLAVGEERCRGLLDELLVAALQRAVPRRDDDDVPVAVGEALGLDVARTVEVLLHEALAPAERGDRLADRRLEQVGDLLDGAGDLQAASPTAVRRLDRDRDAVLLRERHDLVGPADRLLGARHQRRAGPLGEVPGLHLVAQRVDGGRRRPDPGQPGVEDRLGEPGVLGEEAVAGVDGVGAGLGGHGEDLLRVEVGLARCAAAEGERLVGDPDVQRVAVGVGVDGNAG